MLEENMGSVAVCEGAELRGIFTERDVLRLAGEGPAFAEVKVGDVMTRALLTISPDDDAVAAAKLMGERRIRHLPVVQDGMLLGVVGIRDVLRSLVEQVWRDRDETARDTARELLRRSPTVR
jgi:CBS domain-containing protein